MLPTMLTLLIKLERPLVRAAAGTPKKIPLKLGKIPLKLSSLLKNCWIDSLRQSHISTTVLINSCFNSDANWAVCDIPFGSLTLICHLSFAVADTTQTGCWAEFLGSYLLWGAQTIQGLFSLWSLLQSSTCAFARSCYGKHYKGKAGRQQLQAGTKHCPIDKSVFTS